MKKILILAISILLVAGSYLAAATDIEDDSSPLPTPDGNGLMKRFMNQIRDMLGVCQGEVNLTELTGLLSYDGTNFLIGDIELHFGPIWYITTSESAIDYDADGTNEYIFDELSGLVGSEISVEGHYQSENWMSVFTINGETYREIGQPIWAAQHQWRWGQGGHGNGPGGP